MLLSKIYSNLTYNVREQLDYYLAGRVTNKPLDYILRDSLHLSHEIMTGEILTHQSMDMYVIMLAINHGHEISDDIDDTSLRTYILNHLRNNSEKMLNSFPRRIQDLILPPDPYTKAGVEIQW